MTSNFGCFALLRVQSKRTLKLNFISNHGCFYWKFTEKVQICDSNVFSLKIWCFLKSLRWRHWLLLTFSILLTQTSKIHEDTRNRTIKSESKVIIIYVPIPVCKRVITTVWIGNEYNFSVKVTKQLKTRDIIPVDLNSILAWNERILADFHRRLGKLPSANWLSLV